MLCLDCYDLVVSRVSYGFAQKTLARTRLTTLSLSPFIYLLSPSLSFMLQKY